MKPTDARAQAAKLIAQVMQGKSLTALLSGLDHAQKPFVQAMCFGVLRHYFSLQWTLKQLLHKPLPEKDSDITALLLIGLYQLQDGTTKDHAAINEAVSTVAMLRKISYKGLVNAILRNFQRKQTALQKDLLKQDAHHECPDWLLEKLKAEQAEYWESICTASKQAPPMTLRINLTQNSRDDYLNLLKKESIAATPLACESAIQLKNPCPVSRLPGFEEAAISVQDQAGQFVPTLLKLKSGMRILDACSAPGSKLAHLFEACPDAELVAVEVDKKRALRLKDTIKRHNIPAELLVVDAVKANKWWDKKPFDIILLDAPCSATGVIRRHPDIKLLRREEDIPQLAKMQLKLLQALAPLLKPQGQLLYTTCSILEEENDAVLTQFLAENNLKTQPIKLPIGQATKHGWQILPGDEGCDGFYFSLCVNQK